MADSGRRAFKLEVPLDASAVADGAEDQELRVVAHGQGGILASTTVRLGAKRTGLATLTFAQHPGPVRIAVGPARATDEELVSSQTIAVDVPGHRWASARELRVGRVEIAPYFWWWWLRWCREFVIRGRVVCPDGSPVPGAEVCAYDVDWWFWWTSKEQVGCNTTDINGAFEIKFRWCCGLWPWWWWRYRVWDLDLHLAERIKPVLERDPGLQLAATSSQPSLGVFRNILADQGLSTHRALTALDPGGLEAIRGKLLERLPAAPELEALHVWPWWPWWPWWDCTPDIIFRVTQDCVHPGQVVLEETTAQVRWDIPSPLDVTLVATEPACCRRSCTQPPCIEGECLDISDICFASIDEIGGNAGAPSPDGYLFPGAALPGSSDYNGDRPFAGTIPVYKANIMTNVDYYEVEVLNGSTWGPLPAGAAVTFCRRWLQPPHLPAQPLWQSGVVSFPFQVRSGHFVVESREHFEATIGLPPDAFWTQNEDLVVPIDSTRFGDGTYQFHVVGWRDAGAGSVSTPKVLPVCGTDIPNSWVLTFDNRLSPDPTHPTSPDHPCGNGTVHLCVTEPDTDFIAVRVNGAIVDPCGTVDATTGTLEVDFLANDPDGHLAVYSVIATYGENLERDLLSQPSTMLTSLGAAQVGPTYGQALGQGAASPSWGGGKIRLTVDMNEAFPVPCCYQLELRAWKRTVVGLGGAADCGFGCEHDYAYANLSEYTIGVGVCPAPERPPRRLE